MYQRHPPPSASDSLPTEQQAIGEAQARRQSIPRLMGLGLSVAQIAEALGLSIDEVENFLL